MDDYKAYQYYNKLKNEEPTIVNRRNIYWIKDNIITVVNIRKQLNKPDICKLIIFVHELDHDIEVINQELKLDEKDYYNLKLRIMEFIEKYEDKLVTQLLASKESDPMDKLLEDPKDE